MDEERPEQVVQTLGRFKRPLSALLFTLLMVGAYFRLRTPTMAGLSVHELGADEGPALVMLHGYGASGDDLLPFARTILEELPSLRILVVEAPHGVGFGGRTWYNGPLSRQNSVAQVSRLLGVLEADGSPRTQVVLLGFSQGAELSGLVSARLLLNAGEGEGSERPRLAGVAMLSGPATPMILRGEVFISHGRSDPVIAFAGVERQARVHAQTAAVTWAPFNGAHEASPAHAPLFAWLRRVLP